MAEKALTFALLARDQASQAFNTVSRASERAGRSAEHAGRRGSESGRGWLGLRGRVRGAGHEMQLASRESLLAGVGIRSIGIAAAGVGAVEILKGFVGDAREANKVTALTEQVIKSTGGAAGVTARQVEDLTTSISNKTGYDREAIGTGARLLLTFTSVRNEVGKGNDIFNRATQSVTDMSVALGQDTKSSALQLGKALNDPIKGVTALRRAGVSFTASQVEQIKVLVRSGNTLGAQKLILAEVGREFGGAAAAASTPMDKLKVTTHNLGVAVGKMLIPALDSGAKLLSTRVLPAVQGFLSGMKDGTGAGGRFAAVVGTIRDKAAAAFGYFKTDVLPVLRGVASVVGAVLVPAVGFLSGHLRLVVGVVGTLTAAFVAYRAVMVIVTVAQAAMRAVTIATSVASKAAAAGQWLLNAAMTANPIGLVVAAIALLVVGFIYAYKHSETFRKIVQGAFHGVMSVAGDMAGWMIQAFRSILSVWLSVAGGIIHGAALALGWVPGVGGKLKGAERAFEGMKGQILGTLDAMAFAAHRVGSNTSGNLAAGMNQARGRPVSAASSVMANSIAEMRRGSGGAADIGRGIGYGLANGLSQTMRIVVARAQALGAAAVGAAHQGAQVFSPSRATFWTGQMVGEGFVLGMAAKHGAVTGAAARLGQAATGVGSFGTPTAGALAGMAARQAQGALTSNINVTVRMEGTGANTPEARELARELAPHIREALTRDARRNSRDPRL